jgi:hypothetical protein
MRIGEVRCRNCVLFFYSSSVSLGVLFLASKVKSSAKRGPHYARKANMCTQHRVGRVLSFSPVVEIGTPPAPYPHASVPPPPLGPGGGAHSMTREGVGESQFRRGDIHFFVVLFICMYFVVRSVGSVLYTSARTQCMPRLLASFISDV